MTKIKLFENFSHESVEKEFAKQIFVHSSKKSNLESIKKEGLGATDNPVITCGIYTFTEADAKEMFSRSEYDFYYIRLKPDSKILYTDSDRPLDYLTGNFESPFKKEWERIIKETGMNGPEDIMKIFGRGEPWFAWKTKFHRAVEKYLAENGYAGIQEGGQTVITDLNQIASVRLNDMNYAELISVNTEKKFKGNR